ncbi:Crp/Fnr family transcriptional regulator [Flavivirga jejuensis]|uniref:Crp/Fnr family transcriptional regulator n=1 Tax=Flavivirga jejuensis TaxID=870487 RepID=A0ABT8WQB9_9FLAO|nr:Crp/Fnr family transcriptional regulator [Flavivirga jejuensis]MDO5975365.1 Crp/Fnr family transcriptional regulator [Flavivirga jejuensis]
MNNFFIDTFKITTNEAQILSSSFYIEEYSKGDIFLKHGDICNTIGFVKKGLLKSITIGKEKELIDDFIFENQFVADYRSYLTKKKSTKDIICIENCTIHTIHREKLEELSNKYLFISKIEKKVTEHLYVLAEKKFDDLRLLNAKERYLKLFNSNRRLLYKIPQYDIASCLSISPETVSRIRKKLTKRS